MLDFNEINIDQLLMVVNSDRVKDAKIYNFSGMGDIWKNALNVAYKFRKDMQGFGNSIITESREGYEIEDSVTGKKITIIVVNPELSIVTPTSDEVYDMDSYFEALKVLR
jgi:hypothetical protein